MKLLAPLALATILPLSPRQDLGLTVEPGTSLTKTFESRLEIELDEIEVTLTVDGEEQEIGEGPDLELVISEYEHVVFTDEYLEVEDGRATKLRRTFDELSNTSTQEFTSPEGDSEEDSKDGESELQGTTVSFVWDADDEEYAVAFDEDEDADEELLEGLEGDADLTWFLPDDEVDVGDSWEVDITAFTYLSNPSGELKIVQEDDDEERDDEFRDQFRENLDGEITATLESVEDDVALISITISLTTSVETEEELPEDAPPMEATQSMEFAFEIEGSLSWNVAAGHAESLELEGEANVEISNSQSGDQGGVEVEFVQTQIFSGTLAIEVGFE